MKLILTLLLIVFLIVPVLVSADLSSDMKGLESEITDFIGQDTLIAVVGNHATLSEKATLDYFKANHPKGKDLKVYTESNFSEDINNKVLLLVGGKTRNGLSRNLFEKEEINITDNKLSVGHIYFVIDNGQKYIIFSDLFGEANYPNTAVDKSPFSKIMPKEYVPLAATVTGFSLVWLWHLLTSLLIKVGKLTLSSKLMKKVKKKEISAHYLGFKIKGIRIKAREWAAIFGAALVFALTISYTKMISLDTVLALVSVSVVVNFIVYMVRHFSRLAMDKIHKLHTEYKFWIWGAITTVITGWLGNALPLVGYMSKEKTEAKNVEEGRIQFKINLYTFLASLGFFIINLFEPNVIFQMASSLSISIVFVQMLPFSPFSGKAIFKWKRIKWALISMPILLFYILVQLII
ncbi:MAG: hypothetical protein B6U88_02770 [Candidatus Aenigmarchaeota archaeon ex4484_56]|nr:MAG: hypothetical protein B6U88_02770 [Candidatus Aenigmarchaeota archaeon ex4484_56]